MNFEEFLLRECPKVVPTIPLPGGITLAELQAAYGSDPDWPKVKDDPRWLRHLSATLLEKKARADSMDLDSADSERRTADRLSPSERARWCMAHELTRPGNRCRHKRNLGRCTLWKAVLGRVSIAEIETAETTIRPIETPTNSAGISNSYSDSTEGA